MYCDFNGKLLDELFELTLYFLGWNRLVGTFVTSHHGQSEKTRLPSHREHKLVRLSDWTSFVLFARYDYKQRLRWLLSNCCDFFIVGGFSWALDFFWELLPVKDRARRLRDATVPVPTPAIAGGLFAINREWFIELGIYDDGLEVSESIIDSKVRKSG